MPEWRTGELLLVSLGLIVALSCWIAGSVSGSIYGALLAWIGYQDYRNRLYWEVEKRKRGEKDIASSDDKK